MTPEQLATALHALVGAATKPAPTSRDLLRRLAEPFPADAISWRVGPVSEKDPNQPKGKPLAYIDARDVQNRLDEVMGADWQCEYVAMPDGTFCCRIGLKLDGEWRWRSDGGVQEINAKAEENPDAKEMAAKGSYSDAFKRAAVTWGIGRFLYALDAPWVPIQKIGRTYVLPDTSVRQLTTWLARQLRQEPPPRQQPKPAPQPTAETEKPKEKPATSGAGAAAAQPSAPRHAVLVGDGRGKAGLDALHAKVLGVLKDTGKYSAGQLKGFLTKVNKAHAEWIDWRDAEAANMSDEQKAQVRAAMDRFDLERGKITAAIALAEAKAKALADAKAAAEAAAAKDKPNETPHDPQTGELLPQEAA